MKKILFGFLFIFLMLCSCNNKKDEQPKEPADNYINLSKIEEYKWVDKLSEINVIKIRLEHGSCGVAPDSLANIYYSNNKDDIKYNLNLIKSDLLIKNLELLDGGSYDIITFYTDSNNYSININNKMIEYDSSKAIYFENRPKINNIEANVKSFMCTNYSIYNFNNELIGEFDDLLDYEFVKDDNIILDNNNPYKLKIYSNQENILIYDNDVIVINHIKYKIINSRFDLEF